MLEKKSFSIQLKNMNTQVPVKSKENIDYLKHDLKDEAMKELKIRQKRAREKKSADWKL